MLDMLELSCKELDSKGVSSFQAVRLRGWGTVRREADGSESEVDRNSCETSSPSTYRHSCSYSFRTSHRELLARMFPQMIPLGARIQQAGDGSMFCGDKQNGGALPNNKLSIASDVSKHTALPSRLQTPRPETTQPKLEERTLSLRSL
jgi:hypothetical protein